MPALLDDPITVSKRNDQNSSSELLDPDFDWKRYYHLVVRQWWIIAVLVVLVTGSVGAWLARQPSIYMSRAVLQVEQEEKKVLKMDDLQAEKPDSVDFLNTIAQALTNNTVLTRIVEDLHLAEDPSFALLKKEGSTLSTSELAGVLQTRINVSVRHTTRLIDVSAEDKNPARARDLANAVVKQFLRQSFEQRFALSKVASEFLEDESTKLKGKLEASEKKLQEYRETHQAVSLDQSQNITVEKLKELNTQATQAKGDRVRLESDLEQIRRLPQGDTKGMLQIGSVAALPQVADIRQQLVKAEAMFASIKDRYLYKHPKNIAAQNQIRELQSALTGALAGASSVLSRQYEAAKETEEKLNQAVHEQEKAALELNKIAIPYNVLTREVESDRAMYDAVITRLRETAITVGIERSPFRVLEEPTIPTFPSKPEKTKILILTFLLTTVSGFVLVFTLDALDTSVHSVDHAEELLGLPSLATIPSARLKDGPLVIVNDPKSIQAEAFRSLRTSLSLLGNESERRVILFTSAIPAEGKSFTSANAAAAIANEKLKTLLIDADLRRPSLTKTLLPDGDNPLPGLSNYLSDLCGWRDAVVKTAVENLSILPAGERAPDPAVLFTSGKFQTLLEEALLEFDRIVIDTAPVNAVGDTLLIARLAHVVCLVVRVNRTPKKAALRAARMLQKARAHLVGIALNRAHTGSGAGYYYYDYGVEYVRKD